MYRNLPTVVNLVIRYCSDWLSNQSRGKLFKFFAEKIRIMYKQKRSFLGIVRFFYNVW